MIRWQSRLFRGSSDLGKLRYVHAAASGKHISNWQRTTGVSPRVITQSKNRIYSLFKCHGREPVGIYEALEFFDRDSKYNFIIRSTPSIQVHGYYCCLLSKFHKFLLLSSISSDFCSFSIFIVSVEQHISVMLVARAVYLFNTSGATFALVMEYIHRSSTPTLHVPTSYGSNFTASAMTNSLASSLSTT